MTELPDKQFFKIGEVSRLTGVKPHVLRYWETEFSAIRPQKTKTNQRLYRRRDVELLLQIKQLLYQERFTIAGANRRLRELIRGHEVEADGPEVSAVVRRLREELSELLALVDGED